MSPPYEHLSEGAKHAMDAISFGTVVGWAFQILPSVATLLTVLWMCLRIFDWFEARLEKRRLPKD